MARKQILEWCLKASDDLPLQTLHQHSELLGFVGVLDLRWGRAN